MKPNFFYIGTSKAGSTWIYNLLKQHPDIYMAPGKGTYFFDHHYENGLEWYLQHFSDSGQSKILGEVSHSYLFSTEACNRIYEFNPVSKLMACLRDPVDRAFSAYLDRVKNGRFSGSFEEALEAEPSLIDRGRYATHLSCYLETFGRNNIHIVDFAHIKAQPDIFAKDLFGFLEIENIPTDQMDLRARMPAGKPRSTMLTSTAKSLASFAKKLGMKRMIGTVKTSVMFRNLLYRPYTTKDKPQMKAETRLHLQSVFRPEIQKLDQLLGSSFTQKWLSDEPLAAQK